MLRFAFVLIIITLLIDIYAFNGIYAFIKEKGSNVKLIFTIIYWLITAVILVYALIFSARAETTERNPAGMSSMMIFIALYLLIFIPKILFIVFRGIEDLAWLGSYITSLISRVISDSPINIYRPLFISKTGLFISIIPFVAILLGIFGRFNFQTEKQDLYFKDLPSALDGLRIVQISDTHIGSMYNKQDRVQKAIDIINSLEPHIVFFTGDLVNNYSEEALGWEPLFGSINSVYGKYSVLGNHDYGDYWEWNSEQEKAEGLQRLINIQKDMGFNVLLNEWDSINVNGSLLGIIGVENWGLPPFSQHGDLAKALDDLPETNFNILLSHNPTHWDVEVKDKTSIQLTLSGHTHAMQFGFRAGKIQWSPVQYIYDKWMGLYESNGQYLYVNRGLGYIAFPGRVGMRPEITLITLRSGEHVNNYH